MPRSKGPPTKVERLNLSDARKVRFIARHYGILFRDAFNRVSGKQLDDIVRRIKSGEHIELGEAGA